MTVGALFSQSLRKKDKCDSGDDVPAAGPEIEGVDEGEVGSKEERKTTRR